MSDETNCQLMAQQVQQQQSAAGTASIPAHAPRRKRDPLKNTRRSQITYNSRTSIYEPSLGEEGSGGDECAEALRNGSVAAF
jgi:hypothetical protein